MEDNESANEVTRVLNENTSMESVDGVRLQEDTEASYNNGIVESEVDGPKADQIFDEKDFHSDSRRKDKSTTTLSKPTTGREETVVNNAPFFPINPQDTTDQGESDCYPMSQIPRGKAFIINNKNFLPSSTLQHLPRIGTNVDAADLQDLFTRLKFETTIYDNATTDEIRNIFYYYAKMDHSKYNGIICAILSHGKEGLIYGTDGTIEMKELTAIFQVETLHGKPKMFFIQACQGSVYMEGVDQPDGPSVAGAESETLSHDEIDGKNTGITVPIEADYFFAYSTAPSYFSWRSNRGSWFVRSIVPVFNKHAKTMDIQRMMTRVNNMVAKQKSNTGQPESSNKRQIPSVVSQLRKDLYFFPEHIFIDGTDGDSDGPDHETKKIKCSII